MTPGVSGSSGIPAGTLRLFGSAPESEPDPLLAEAGRSLLCARLLEDGDRADLRWLLGAIGAEAISAWFAEHGGRLLSPRSRAFWALVLERESGPSNPAATALWPG